MCIYICTSYMHIHVINLVGTNINASPSTVICTINTIYDIPSGS